MMKSHLALFLITEGNINSDQLSYNQAGVLFCKNEFTAKVMFYHHETTLGPIDMNK